jgi:2-polyprenyl-6-hydroxyphenyl methylase/3-demethylubiquinone-9 3-methyltransferase
MSMASSAVAAPAGSAATGPAVDQAELDKFAALGRGWWDPDGPMAPLHKLNPVRVAYLRDRARERFGRAATAPRPLEGLDALDVGCGGGLLAEPLARLGAAVTGIDPLTSNVETARWHAEEVGLGIEYLPVTLDALVAAGRRFDLVVASEVVEHVPDVPAFLAELAAVTRPGGLVVLSTLSRTTWSFLKAIVGVEYVLGWLPRGTHDWRRFLRPAELARALRAAGLRPAHLAGIAYDPGRDSFALDRRRTDTNYLLAATRDG